MFCLVTDFCGVLDRAEVPVGPYMDNMTEEAQPSGLPPPPASPAAVRCPPGQGFSPAAFAVPEAGPQTVAETEAQARRNNVAVGVPDDHIPGVPAYMQHGRKGRDADGRSEAEQSADPSIPPPPPPTNARGAARDRRAFSTLARPTQLHASSTVHAARRWMTTARPITPASDFDSVTERAAAADTDQTPGYQFTSPQAAPHASQQQQKASNANQQGDEVRVEYGSSASAASSAAQSTSSTTSSSSRSQQSSSWQDRSPLESLPFFSQLPEPLTSLARMVTPANVAKVATPGNLATVAGAFRQGMPSPAAVAGVISHVVSTSGLRMSTATASASSARSTSTSEPATATGSGSGGSGSETGSSAAASSSSPRPSSSQSASSGLCSSRKPTKAQMLAEILRVDHAGEYGAQRIYDGQLAVLGAGKAPTGTLSTQAGADAATRGEGNAADLIEEMRLQEIEHLRTLERLLPEHRTRPTALLPIWHVAGFALGAGSALLGPRAAMACTVAVEEVITHHYNEQLRTLNQPGFDSASDRELRAVIKKHRDDEEHHRDIGLAHDAKLAPLYALMTGAIQAGCHAAIWISKKV